MLIASALQAASLPEIKPLIILTLVPHAFTVLSPHFTSRTPFKETGDRCQSRGEEEESEP